MAASLSSFGLEREAKAWHPARHLLLLPAEIRLSIYESAFSYSAPEIPDASKALAPLLVCRQIYNEASNLAFSLTQFKIKLKCVVELPSRLQTLRPSRRKNITQLNILASYRYYHELRPDDISNFWMKLDQDGLPSLQLEVLTFTVRITETPSPWADFYTDLMNSIPPGDLDDAKVFTVWQCFGRHWLRQATTNKIILISFKSDIAGMFMLGRRARVEADVWEYGVDWDDVLQKQTLTLTRREPLTFSRA